MSTMSFIKQIALFSFVLGGSLYALEVDVVDKKPFAMLTLKICPSLDEIVYKDSIRISFRHPTVSIKKWNILSEPQEEYISSLKLHKKVYKERFFIKIKFDGDVQGGNLYYACFVVHEEGTIVPFLQHIMLPKTKESDNKREKNAALSIEQKKTPLLKRGVSYLQTRQHNDHPLWLLNTKLLLLLFLLLLFIGFILVDILALKDIFILLGLGSWVYGANRLLSYPIMLSGSAILSLFASMWYLYHQNRGRQGLKWIRLVLGLLCAAAVLPLLIEAYFA